ncbi:DUF4845 domain-containing protein [Gilvimarinus algae]|uniref:DUF4845 domain-containing protein n=1 Tax=Gilvimarinus algae TaxID=3058037 RepID=A0ABT8TJ33_9GAMM|nr:DUF4845 domain-containing protein [Gilvimarinus sp. SDUM040014]MDO3384108.1 DUF4845 domain-containing protein [Gilvimarinus sp. SDUM040014]
MRTDSSQRGLSSIGWLLVIIVVVFACMCAAKLTPVYLENYYIVNGLKALAENNEESLKRMSRAEITRKLESYFSINSVRSPGAKELEFIQNSKGIVIVNQYETRVPLIANIDVVMSFHNVLDSSNPDQCCEPPPEAEKP